MKRWNIQKILLFSHDNRRRDVTFDIAAVNIITGRSNTGKSALTEIIDYVMGAGDCHVPSYVRDSCSWFGILWVKAASQFLICRKAPAGNRKQDPAVFIDIGTELTLPPGAEGLERNRDVEKALRAFEDLLGIPDIKVDAYAPTRPKERITFRHVLPFLIQDDSTIIDKNRLLWYGSDENRDEKLTAQINRVPFFLGAVDVETVALEGELTRLRRQLRLAEQHHRDAQRLVGEATNRAQALVTEAVSVGLIDGASDDASRNDPTARLAEVAEWQPLTSAEQGQATNALLDDLYVQKGQLESNLSRLRSRVRSVEHLAGITNQFDQSTGAQRDRLEVIRLIPDVEVTSTCPTCAQSLEAVTSSVSDVQRVYTRIQGELAQVERQRPRLSLRADELREEVSQQRSQLDQLKQQIAAAVREDEIGRERLELDQRRMRVVGRISLYLETLGEHHADEAPDGKIEELRQQVRELERQIDADAKREALEEKRMLISREATNIINDLPFDERHRGAQVDFNPRDLSIGVITPRRRESMRNIGSDENYLSLHLSVMLALHRYFVQADRPVPGVLLLDQLSRPYFPPDLEEEVEISDADGERMKLKQYFDLLFAETSRSESMQFIVLEHAYFKDDPRFTSATKERWVEGEEFLVPSDWPGLPL